MYTWIDLLSITAALAGSLVAAAIDYRTLKIPNRLTLPLILLGLILLALRCLAGFPLFAAVVTCAIVYAFVHVLWRFGMWGGGDAKLVLGLFLLLSPAYPWLEFVAVFSLILAALLFLKHAGLRALRVRRDCGAIEPLSALGGPRYKPHPMGPTLLLACLISIGAFTAGLVP